MAPAPPGPGTAAHWWARGIRADFPPVSADADPLLLTGEMKESAIFRDEAALRPFAGAMELLNARDDWPVLRTAIEGNVDVVCSNDGGFHKAPVVAFCAQYGMRIMTSAELLRLLIEQ